MDMSFVQVSHTSVESISHDYYILTQYRLLGCARRMRVCFDCRNVITSKEGLRESCLLFSWYNMTIVHSNNSQLQRCEVMAHLIAGFLNVLFA